MSQANKVLRNRYRENVSKYKNILRDLDLEDEDVAVALVEYVSTHKWLINESIPFEVTFDQAMYSWYENVYVPIMSSMKRTQIVERFFEKYFTEAMRKMTRFDVFQKVSDEYYSQNQIGNTYCSYDKACFAVAVKNDRLNWLERKLGYIL